MSLRQLMATPNPDDPLDADIAKEFQFDHPTYLQNAREMTKKYANEEAVLNEQEEEEEEEEEDDVKKRQDSVKTEKDEYSKFKLEKEEEDEMLVKEESTQPRRLGLSLSRKKASSSQSTTTVLSQASSTFEIKSSQPKGLSLKRTVKTEKKIEKVKKVEKIKEEEIINSADDLQTVKKEASIKVEKVKKSEKKVEKKVDDVEKIEKEEKLKIEEKGTKSKAVEKVKPTVKKEDKMELDDDFEGVDSKHSATIRKTEKKAKMDLDEQQLERHDILEFLSQGSTKRVYIEDDDMEEVLSQKKKKKRSIMGDSDEEEEASSKKEQQRQYVSMINLSSPKLKTLSSQKKELNSKLPNKATETSAYFNSPTTTTPFIPIESNDEDMPLLLNREDKSIRDVTNNGTNTKISTSSSRSTITTTSFINQEVIDLLSDSEEDDQDDFFKSLHNSQASEQPRLMHSLQLSKKLTRNKLSLSKKKTK